MVQKSGGGPAPFLTKTYEMVEDERTNDVISWGPKGTSFVVWKPVEFARDLLPLHFKHCNLSSFVRQLNTYGFRKVVPDRWEFANDNFRRGEQMLLSDICRRKTIPTNRNPSNINPASSILNSAEMHSSSSTSSPALPPRSPPVSDNILELTNENEMLRKENQSLSNELEHAKRHFDELLGFLSNFVDVSKLNFDTVVKENVATCFKEKGGCNRVKGKQKEVDESVAKDKGLKIFGVLLKGFEEEESSANKGSRKRSSCENQEIGERPSKMSFGLPWIGVPTSL